MIIFSIIATIIAIILNFNETLMGSQATLVNFIVTAIYLSVWIWLMILGAKSKAKRLNIYFGVFWSITLLTSISTIFANIITKVDFTATIPLVIIFLTPLYGIRFFNLTFLTCSVIYAILSTVFALIGFASVKRNN
ncbi:hypothetical protein EEL30_19905 [Brevibacillus laterosporus]|uniref:Uncharacterized protein n=1 Tax=Brevibacillus laterosporus TaxID=1465 RepID=A0A518VBH6_BRELA|nr:hypothetical protein EEL30_19905 [Brevibacillus laterosporus]